VTFTAELYQVVLTCSNRRAKTIVPRTLCALANEPSSRSMDIPVESLQVQTAVIMIITIGWQQHTQSWLDSLWHMPDRLAEAQPHCEARGAPSFLTVVPGAHCHTGSHCAASDIRCFEAQNINSDCAAVQRPSG